MLTETQIHALFNAQLISHATWCNALRQLRGEAESHLGPQALRTCEAEIASLAERAINAACKLIQDRLGVTTGDLAAATLSDGTMERELERYILAELDSVVSGPVQDVEAH